MAFNSAIELPLPLASGTRVISNALRAVDARPTIRSSCAQRITWSQPAIWQFITAFNVEGKRHAERACGDFPVGYTGECVIEIRLKL